MQKFVDVDYQVAAVREKLTGFFNQQGRDRMRQQIERYCREVLEPAIKELGEDDRSRHQLEAEWTAMQEAMAELKPATGRLRLAR
jgi:hypothetical protein